MLWLSNSLLLLLHHLVLCENSVWHLGGVHLWDTRMLHVSWLILNLRLNVTCLNLLFLSLLDLNNGSMLLFLNVLYQSLPLSLLLLDRS